MRHTPRLASIDIVRGLACLGVFFTHYFDILSLSANEKLSLFHNIYDAAFDHLFWGAGGIHSSVVVFITLSGFCIHRRVAFRQKQLTRCEITRYLRTRSQRILPVFYVGLLLGIILISYSSPLQAISENWLDWVFSLLLVSELLRFIFPTVTAYGNGPLATVINEIYIYLFYPIFQSFRGRRLIPFFFSASFLSYCLVIYFRFFPPTSGIPVGSVFELLTYWLIGALGVELCSLLRHKQISVKPLCFLAALLYTIYLFSINIFSFSGFHVLVTPFLSIISALAICALVILEERHSISLLLILLQPFALLGIRSFSLYVVHTPLVRFCRDIASALGLLDSTLLPVVSIVIVLLVTELVYTKIELPRASISSRYPSHVP